MSTFDWDGEAAISLPGGDVTAGVVRIGGTVRRPRQAQSSFVEAYLRHLEAFGFDGAPRFLGTDGLGRDVLTFVEGEVPAATPEAWAWTDDVLAALANLVRRLHDASEGFVPPPGLPWFGRDRAVELPPHLADAFPRPELVTHSDITPQNTVFRGGLPVALVDFDMARPSTRVQDVVNIAVHWVPLSDPADLDPRDSRRGRVAERMRLLADAYGLTGLPRKDLVRLALVSAERSWYLMRANAEQFGGGWARMWKEGVGERIAARRTWLEREGPALEAALR